MSRFKTLNERLDHATVTHSNNWLMVLQEVRVAADAAMEAGTLRPSEWEALVSRSARIQDSMNYRLSCMTPLPA